LFFYSLRKFRRRPVFLNPLVHISHQKVLSYNFFWKISKYENVEVFGELKMFLPKLLERKCKSKLIWTKLTKIWQSDHNLVKGFFLNLVKGGYAIAIASHIASFQRIFAKVEKSFIVNGIFFPF